jgi:hypothetical protein
MNFPANPLPLIVMLALLVPLAIVAFFALVLAVIAKLGGWQKLAEAYPAQTMQRGTPISMQSVNLRRWAGYNNCVTFSANDAGMWMQVMWPFSFRHPPLFFPWSEVEVAEENLFGLIRMVRLQMLATPNVPVRISKKLARRLRAAAGKSWPGPNWT